MLIGALIVVLMAVFTQLAPPPAAPTAGPGVPQAGDPTGPLGIIELDAGWFASHDIGGRADATRVAVDRVVDGDTMDVRASAEVLRIRFYGIDTTERGQACFSEATARTTALVGRAVVLVPDARLQDSFKRELRYVFAPDGRSIDATLVAEGLARGWRDDGVLRDRLVAIEQDARKAKRGCLWKDS